MSSQQIKGKILKILQEIKDVDLSIKNVFNRYDIFDDQYTYNFRTGLQINYSGEFCDEIKINIFKYNDSLYTLKTDLDSFFNILENTSSMSDFPMTRAMKNLRSMGISQQRRQMELISKYGEEFISGLKCQSDDLKLSEAYKFIRLSFYKCKFDTYPKAKITFSPELWKYITKNEAITVNQRDLFKLYIIRYNCVLLTLQSQNRQFVLGCDENGNNVDDNETEIMMTDIMMRFDVLFDKFSDIFDLIDINPKMTIAPSNFIIWIFESIYSLPETQTFFNLTRDIIEFENEHHPETLYLSDEDVNIFVNGNILMDKLASLWFDVSFYTLYDFSVLTFGNNDDRHLIGKNIENIPFDRKNTYINPREMDLSELEVDRRSNNEKRKIYNTKRENNIDFSPYYRDTNVYNMSCLQ
jgi:hypothetical protein